MDVYDGEIHVHGLLQVVPSSVIICNHSGERYWYAWDDGTGTKMYIQT